MTAPAMIKKFNLVSILIIPIACLAIAGLFASELLADPVNTITVAEGDTAALIAAVDEANRAGEGDLTIIRVSGLYDFGEDDFFSPIAGRVVIEGMPGVVTTFDANTTSTARSIAARGPDNLFKVESDGALTIRHVDIANFGLSGHPANEKLALFENEGELKLQSMLFKHVVGNVSFPGVISMNMNSLIDNFGELTIEEVAFVDVGSIYSARPGQILNNEAVASLTNVLVALTVDYIVSEISNSGRMKVLNSTFIGKNAFENHPISTEFDGQTEIGNSVFKGYDSAWCTEAISLGHNVFTGSRCDFQAEGDLVGIGTVPLVQELVPAKWHGPEPHHFSATPRPDSILIDSADTALCPATDLLGQSRYFDGDGDGVASCDRGAIEFSGSILKTGGITGYYFDRDSDGHYLFVLDNPYNVLVTWNTFDRIGRQAWIYATGKLDEDGSLEADAYINLNGRLTDFGPVDIERAKRWGKIRIEFDSCLKGFFSWDSTNPDFGSGEFEFDRLAYSRQVGCAD